MQPVQPTRGASHFSSPAAADIAAAVGRRSGVKRRLLRRLPGGYPPTPWTVLAPAASGYPPHFFDASQ